MRRALVPWIFALALAVVPGPCRAGLSLSGSTGLITIPTALTLRQYEGDVAFDVWSLGTQRGSSDFNVLRGAIGVQDGGDAGVELGITKPHATPIGLRDAYVFGKYRIPGVLPGGALAVGGVFSTDKSHYSSLYLVGSSAIAPKFALHYGGGVNIYGDPFGWSWFGGRRENGRADGGFALFGGEYDWRRFKVNVDYNGSFLSYGVNYFPDSFFSLSLFKLGSGDFERSTGIRHRAGIGATFRF